MSVVANVAINVDSRGATQKLREVQQAAQQAQRALEGIGGSAAQPLRSASSSASELIGVLGRLSAAYIGLRTAQQAVQAGIQREESERRLSFLAKGYGEVAQAQELAARAGRQFGLSATESNQQFAQLYGRLRPLNISIEDINTAFVGFNTAAKVSGSTAAESAGALLQLTQALGSGVLRGQELNSVLEQAPGLVVALTKELGRPVSEIRKLAEQGEITSEVVIRALKRAGTEGADELSAALNGPAQAIKNLQNEFEDFQVAATKDLIPAITGAVRELRSVLESLGPTIRAIGGIAAQTLGTIADLINAATKPGATAAAIAIRGGRLPLAGLGGMSGAGELFKGTSGAFGPGLTGIKAEAAFLAKERRQPVTKVLLDLMQNRLQRMETPVQAPVSQMPSTFVPSGAGETKKKGKTDAERAAEKLKKEIERSLELGDRLGTEFSRQVVLLETSAEVERKRLQIQYDYEDRAKQISELKNAEQRVNLTDLNNEIKRLEIIQLQTEELKAQIEEYYKRAGLTAGEALPGGAGAFRTDINLGPQNKVATFIESAQKDLQDLETRAISVAQGIGDALANSLVGGIQGLIAGTQSAKEVFASFLQSIGQILAQEGTKMIATYIAIGIAKMFAGLGSSGIFSGAGPVQMPGGAGFAEGFSLPSLLPARASGGPVASNTPYMVGEQGPELFVPNAGGSIVNNKDLRSAMTNGAGSSGGTVLNMNFETTNIGGVEYVSRDQLEAAMAATRRDAARDGAKRGMSMTLDKLQQSPGTRGRVGLR